MAITKFADKNTDSEVQHKIFDILMVRLIESKKKNDIFLGS